MNQIQKPQNSISPDLIVVGGGIFGLWAARHAIKRGERVLVLEKREIGAGASGGFLGALMPHMPDNWEAKKQLQFAALSSMPAAIARLEAETGIDCG
ncbi:MAG: FAD-dependent oxidoreductase, partial [Salaquimonas sp.]